jgi:putative inorganic carbon (HCO3(-)) transporter
MNVAISLLLAMVGISLYATFDIRFSLGKVSGVVLGALLLWSIARWLTTPGRLRVGVAVFLLAGASLAVVGLLGINGVGKVSALGVVIARLPIAIRGVPGAEGGANPNAIAGCLVLFVPLQVALFSTGGHRWFLPLARRRWVGRLLVVIQAILLFLTAAILILMQSRGAWLGLVVGTVAFLVWQSRLTRMLAALAAGAVVILTALLGPENLASLAISRSGLSNAGDLPVRVELWSGAIHGIQDFPLAGMGMNAFRRVGPIRYLALQPLHGRDIVHAHNHLLQAALDLGLPGLVAYVSIWMVAAMLLVMVYRQSRERIYRAMAGGLGAGLVAHFVFSMTDTIALGAKVGVLFWLTLALVVSLHRVALEYRPYQR